MSKQITLTHDFGTCRACPGAFERRHRGWSQAIVAFHTPIALSMVTKRRSSRARSAVHHQVVSQKPQKGCIVSAWACSRKDGGGFLSPASRLNLLDFISFFGRPSCRFECSHGYALLHSFSENLSTSSASHTVLQPLTRSSLIEIIQV